MIISTLYPLGYRISSSLYFIGFYNQYLEERDNCYSQEERHHQVDSNCPGEVLDGIVEGSLHRDEQREENDADT